jgi:secreted Zn-dependent insulinase-like peptidase
MPACCLLNNFPHCCVFLAACSANLMRAAVYGRHSLDELQALAVEAFTPVVNQELPTPSFTPDIVTDEVSGGHGFSQRCQMTSNRLCVLMLGGQS